MTPQQIFNEYFKPALLTYLKAKKEEMESVGTIPTLEEVIKDLEDNG